jgi:mannan endo-1,4-beta-mannosidase
MTAFPQTFNLVSSAGGTTFTMLNGLIKSPSTGATFIARGINVYQESQGVVSTNNACQPLTTLFPKCNFIRMVARDSPYQPASYFQTFINQATALGIVVEIEHHVGAGGGVPPLTGSDLTAENAWFQGLATAFKSNPYVWFGTMNEPSGPGNTLTTQQLSNYNTIRAAGNSSPIMLEVLGGYGSGIQVLGSGEGLTPNSAYAGMTNVIWDVHIYNGLPDFKTGNNTNSYSTSQTFLNGMVLGYISQAQTIPSADGTVPVIIGEYGISTDDENLDPGGTQTCIAVQQSGVGCAAWNWQSGGSYDILTTNNNALTTYGAQVAGWINS